MCCCLIAVKTDAQQIKSEDPSTSPTKVQNEKTLTVMETGPSSVDEQHQSQELEQIGDKIHKQNDQDQPIEQKLSSESKMSDQELHTSQDQLVEQMQDQPNQDIKQIDQESNQDKESNLKPVEGSSEQLTRSKKHSQYNTIDKC